MCESTIIISGWDLSQRGNRGRGDNTAYRCKLTTAEVFNGWPITGIRAGGHSLARSRFSITYVHVWGEFRCPVSFLSGPTRVGDEIRARRRFVSISAELSLRSDRVTCPSRDRQRVVSIFAELSLRSDTTRSVTISRSRSPFQSLLSFLSGPTQYRRRDHRRKDEFQSLLSFLSGPTRQLYRSPTAYPTGFDLC